MTPTTARRNRRPIDVESRIHAPVDAVWDAAELRHLLEVTDNHRHQTSPHAFDRLVAKHGLPRIRFHDLRSVDAQILSLG